MDEAAPSLPLGCLSAHPNSVASGGLPSPRFIQTPVIGERRGAARPCSGRG
jgi:hypothetical protein